MIQIGRMVHFFPPRECVAGGPSKRECYAAIVVGLNEDGTVELATFGPNSVYFQHNVPMLMGGLESGWAWPPRGKE